MIIKVSDIGNVTKGREYCLKWTESVIQEFLAQGDLEGEMNLPVTPFMDRKTANVPKQQLGFYNFVVKPMFEALDLLVSMEARSPSVTYRYTPFHLLVSMEARSASVTYRYVDLDSGASRRAR